MRRDVSSTTDSRLGVCAAICNQSTGKGKQCVTVACYLVVLTSSCSLGLNQALGVCVQCML